MRDHFKKFDIKTLEYINKKLSNSLLDKIMPIITSLANFGVIWIIIALSLLLTEQYRISGIMVISALVLNTILGEGIIKHIIKRERPFAKEDNNRLLISKPITYSFPSGHTSSSFAVTGVLIATNITISIYVMILSILIAFSRIYLNVHYPSDVFSGVLLGVICSFIVVFVFRLSI